MRISLVLFAFMSFLVLTVPFVSASNEQTYSVVITVLDENTDPVVGASVSISGIKKTTDTNGAVAFVLEKGEYTVSAEYRDRSATEEIDVQGNTSFSISFEDETARTIEFFQVLIIGILLVVIVFVGIRVMRRKRR